jgi:hypothetical protein
MAERDPESDMPKILYCIDDDPARVYRLISVVRDSGAP